MKTFDEKDVMLAANAIGWIFFGNESEDGVVEVSEEDSDKCITAAKRALEHIEKRKELNDE